MKKFILPLVITLALNNNAFAVDAATSVVEDPKKADEVLVKKSTKKKLTLDEKRAALKAKHQAKNEAKAAAKAKQAAAALSTSADVTQATPDPLKDIKRDERIQAIKDESAPKK